jgi:hypothetical protein
MSTAPSSSTNGSRRTKQERRACTADFQQSGKLIRAGADGLTTKDTKSTKGAVPARLDRRYREKKPAGQRGGSGAPAEAVQEAGPGRQAGFTYYLLNGNYSIAGTGNADGSVIERLDYSATGDFAGGGPGAISVDTRGRKTGTGQEPTACETPRETREKRDFRGANGEAGIRTRETGVTRSDGLANRWFQPLTHLSSGV